MLRSGTFSKFGTVPAIMATCKYWKNLSRGSPLSSYNIWQDAKNSWHAAKSTPHDPPWSWSDPYLTSVPKIGQEKAVFCVFLTLTFDPDLPKISIRSPMSIYITKIRSVGLLAAAGEVVTDRRNHRPLLWIKRSNFDNIIFEPAYSNIQDSLDQCPIKEIISFKSVF